MAIRAAIGMTFLKRAPLALAAIFLTLTTALAAEPHHPHLRYAVRDNALVMLWSGKIEAPMSTEIAAAFEMTKDRVKFVELKLDSGGGSVKEGEEVIRVLQDIRKTHKLVTALGAGKRCGSMCVFIYVQGERRLAAPASLWLFHEVSISDHMTHQIVRLDRGRWEELVDKYWVPAGVNPAWIAEVKTHTNQTDYWQAGESLLQSDANLIQKALSDENRRKVTPVNDSESPAVLELKPAAPDHQDTHRRLPEGSTVQATCSGVALSGVRERRR